MFHRVFMKCASGVAAGLIATTATAAPGDGPDLNISAGVDGRFSSDTIAGISLGGINYLYEATLTDSDTYAIDWQMIINNDAGSGVEKGIESLNGSITVQNTGSKSLMFVIDTNFNVDLAGD